MQYSKIFSVVALLVAAAAAAPICPDVPASHPAGGPAPGLPFPGMPAHGANGVPGVPGVPGHAEDGPSSTGGVQQAAMACSSATYTQSSCCDVAAGTCNAVVVGAICPEINNIATSNMCCLAQPSNQQNTEQNGVLNVAVPISLQTSCVNVL